MEKVGQDQQQRNEQTSQSHQAKGKEVQTAELSKQESNQHHKDKEGQKDQNKTINQQGGTSRLQQDNNRANEEYQNNFPRISNNYARYDHNLQKNRKVDNQVNNNVAQGNVKHPDSQQQG
ncbi:hypothetical protein KY290_025948 [Solanum tuberosum]|uniref:Mating channel protein n=1 Tax=Solanum tuberosum TaxID=4113 RepID=A0ABQ7UX01_SOLTU|nr:hypothetical protein KY290_025948 [Solanum tuberosum]